MLTCRGRIKKSRETLSVGFPAFSKGGKYFPVRTIRAKDGGPHPLNG